MPEMVRFIRYPGGKQRILEYILPYLPSRNLIKGKYIEPFVGGGAVFFAVNPECALLSDINKELIDLYRGIRLNPSKVWEIYESFPQTKKGYYEIRALRVGNKNLIYRAARTLYLNRTCFKGMWRYNSKGEFNIGYGGQDRRWVLSKETLNEVGYRLKLASLKCCDFQKVIDASNEEDFIFIDPPYRPGELGIDNAHYVFNSFGYKDHLRLATALVRASDRGVRWVMTASCHPEILSLFNKYMVKHLPKGIGGPPGRLVTDNPKEVLIYNLNSAHLGNTSPPSFASRSATFLGISETTSRIPSVKRYTLENSSSTSAGENLWSSPAFLSSFSSLQ